MLKKQQRHCLMGLCLTAGLCLLSANWARAQGVTALYVMSPDGSNVRKLAGAPGFARVGHARWSHDGKRLAFHAWDGPPGVRRVFVVNADASGLHEIASYGQLPDWSPDDKQLVVQNVGDNSADVGAWVENLDGSGRTFLVPGLSPRWSSDGSQLAFIQDRSLVTRDLVDETERSLLDGRWDDIQAGFDWSPRRKQIGFVGRRQGKLGLWIVDVGKPPARLRLEGSLMGQVAWSPDGKRLAVTLDAKIHLLNPDDANAPRVIPGQLRRSRDPAWSPDGKSIAFSSDREAGAR
jgi:Tol biopolymer transport system component